MQYTGLKDANDKEIYEGDIVTKDTGDDLYYLIEFKQDDAKFVMKNLRNRPMFFESRYIDIFNGCCEIVGNIYENPELLEGETS